MALSTGWIHMVFGGSLNAHASLTTPQTVSDYIGCQMGCGPIGSAHMFNIRDRERGLCAVGRHQMEPLCI